MLAKGATRAVLCVGTVALKFARSAHGALCNRYEADLYRRSEPHRRALLCPPLWCSPSGAVLVMRRARLLTEAELRVHVNGYLLDRAWGYRGPDDDGLPFEYHKPNDWGWLDGRVVAVDYANFDEESLRDLLRD
jgi:hypothetical protein